MKLSVNGQVIAVDVDPDMPLLWAIRDGLKLTGTKYGCGVAQCGACTVLADNRAIRSCSISAADAQGMAITTIEGLGGNHPLQLAWLKLDVAQCGYCQSGSDHAGGGATEGQSQADRYGHRSGHERQYLPLRYVPAN